MSLAMNIISTILEFVSCVLSASMDASNAQWMEPAQGARLAISWRVSPALSAKIDLQLVIFVLLQSVFPVSKIIL